MNEAQTRKDLIDPAIEKAGLGFPRLDAAKDDPFEISRAAKKLVFGWGHGDLTIDFFLNQLDRADQVGDLEKLVSGWLDALGKFDRRQKSRREYAMKKICNWSLSAIVIDFNTVKFPQFEVVIPKNSELLLDFVYNLLGRIDKSFIDDKRMVSEVRLTHEAHHERKYLGTKLPAKNLEFVRLANDRACVETHSFEAKMPNAYVKIIGQNVDGLRLVVEDHREEIEARSNIRWVKHPGLIDENTQYSFIQSAPHKNISDGNRFSSLKAKNILRFSVIPSFRKASLNIIAHFCDNFKWKMENSLIFKRSAA